MRGLAARLLSAAQTRLFSRHDFLHDGLVQAALRDQLAALAVYFLEQHPSGGIDKTYPAKIQVKLLARRTRLQLPPALFQCRYPGACQPPLHTENCLSALLFGCDS